MELPIEHEQRPEGDLVGLSEMPASLSGINWGALLLGFIWASFHGVWSWAAILAVMWFVAVGAAGAVTRFFGDALTPHVIHVAVYTLVHRSALLILAARANRLYWVAERRRFERQSDQSVPRYPPTVDAYARRQRRWLIAGVLFFVYSFVMAFIVSGSVRPWFHAVSLVNAGTEAVIIIGIFVWDRTRRLRAS